MAQSGGLVLFRKCNFPASMNGKVLKLNQIIESCQYFTPNNADRISNFSKTDNTLKFDTTQTGDILFNYPYNYVSGNKLYIKFSTNNNKFKLKMIGSDWSTGSYNNSTGSTVIYSNKNVSVIKYGGANTTTTYNDVVISDVLCVNLTKMFGEGNEPTKEEFEEWFGIDYIPYTEETEVVVKDGDLWIDINFKDVEFIDYIESTGTQYIKSGVFHNLPKLKVSIDLSYFSGGWIFGARKAYRSDAFLLVNASNRFLHYGNASMVQDDVDIKIGKKYNIILNNGELIINGVSKGTARIVTTEQYELILFGITNDKNVTYDANLRYYACKIESDGVLIRDFRPCIYKKTAVGLWDMVEGKFYGNSGTGEFIQGPILNNKLFINGNLVNSISLPHLYKKCNFPASMNGDVLKLNQIMKVPFCDSLDDILSSSPVELLDDGFNLTGASAYNNGWASKSNFIVGHKYYFRELTSGLNCQAKWHTERSFNSGSGQRINDIKINSDVPVIVDVTGGAVFSNRFYGLDQVLTIKKINAIDLTTMFGAGNEPTAEQFNSWLGDDYVEYTPEPIECVVKNGNLYYSK